jgi:hypothetical protein
MKLIRYRDAGMHTHTYFWTDSNHRVVSPYFDREEDAKEWSEDKLTALDDPKRKRPRCHIKKKPAQHARPSITSEVNTVLARVGILDQCQSTRRIRFDLPRKNGFRLIKAKWHDGS